MSIVRKARSHALGSCVGPRTNGMSPCRPPRSAGATRVFTTRRRRDRVGVIDALNGASSSSNCSRGLVERPLMDESQGGSLGVLHLAPRHFDLAVVKDESVVEEAA